MQYAIIKREKLEDLVKHINAIIPEGWEPLGGIAYDPGFTSTYASKLPSYIQAVRHSNRAPESAKLPC